MVVLEARAAQVCLKIFQSLENTIFVFEDAHWIDSQSWIMLQMVLPQLVQKYCNDCNASTKYDFTTKSWWCR